MPKQKRHSGAKKRFKVTGTGKLLRRKAMNHYLGKKSAKRKRSFGRQHDVDPSDYPRGQAHARRWALVARVKRSVASRKRRKKVLDAAKGYRRHQALPLQGRERGGRARARPRVP